jgi:hypothetical protein
VQAGRERSGKQKVGVFDGAGETADRGALQFGSKGGSRKAVCSGEFRLRFGETAYPISSSRALTFIAWFSSKWFPERVVKKLFPIHNFVLR